MDSEKIISLLPEIGFLTDVKIKESCILTWLEAVKIGNWDEKTLIKIPFVLNELENCPVTLLSHVRNVTDLALTIYEKFSNTYNEYIELDRDAIIAGALLHDVGKLLEYKLKDNCFVYSENEKYLRHPLAGALIAKKCGVPDNIIHIIATHSFEGTNSKRTPESFIVRNADWLNFDFLSFHFESTMNHK